MEPVVVQVDTSHAMAVASPLSLVWAYAASIDGARSTNPSRGEESVPSQHVEQSQIGEVVEVRA
jgi:hypothetical protein